MKMLLYFYECIDTKDVFFYLEECKSVRRQ